MKHPTRFAGTLVAALCLPLVALAQATSTPASSSTAAARPVDQAQAAPQTREAVSREVREAMRDGTWRCLTNNRGGCSTPLATLRASSSKVAAK